MSKLVLVTGAGGFLGSHTVKALLQLGYRVRGTIRSLKNEQQIKALKELCPQAAEKLELVEADLTLEQTWHNAVKGCEYVLHLASPVMASYKHEDEVVKPAVEGTMNVLKAVAATKGAVKRVVLTSSVVTICYGTEVSPERIFTEDDWTNPDGKDVDPYIKSKLLAEKAAWLFVQTLSAQEKFELTTLCPGFILGPILLDKTGGEGVQVIKHMMTSLLPLVPSYMIPMVDVRDVARAHIAAMKNPGAVNQRIIVADDCYWFKDIAEALHSEFSNKGYSIGKGEAPELVMGVVSWFDNSAAYLKLRHGLSFKIDTSKVKKILQIKPIPMRKAAVDMAYSLIEKGIVPKRF